RGGRGVRRRLLLAAADGDAADAEAGDPGRAPAPHRVRLRGVRDGAGDHRPGHLDARARGLAVADDLPQPARRRRVRHAHPRPLARGRGGRHARPPHPQGAADPVKRVQTVGLYGLAILLALWTLFPIYLITLGAFSTQDAIYSYPLQLWPHHVSQHTLGFFI